MDARGAGVLPGEDGCAVAVARGRGGLRLRQPATLSAPLFRGRTRLRACSGRARTTASANHRAPDVAHTETCRSRLVAAEGDDRGCRRGNGSVACRAGKWSRLSRQVRPALDRACRRRRADAEQDRGPGRVGEADDAAGTPGGVARDAAEARAQPGSCRVWLSSGGAAPPRAAPPRGGHQAARLPSRARVLPATPRAVARRGKRRADAGSRRSGSDRGWTGRIGMRCLAANPLPQDERVGDPRAVARRGRAEPVLGLVAADVPVQGGRACSGSPRHPASWAGAVRRHGEHWLGAAAPSRCPSVATDVLAGGECAQSRTVFPAGQVGAGRACPAISASIGSAQPRRAGARSVVRHDHGRSRCALRPRFLVTARRAGRARTAPRPPYA